MLSKVVFPLPDGPIRANTSFGRQQPVMSYRICKQKKVNQHTTMTPVCGDKRMIGAFFDLGEHKQETYLPHVIICGRSFDLFASTAFEAGE